MESNNNNNNNNSNEGADLKQRPLRNDEDSIKKRKLTGSFSPNTAEQTQTDELSETTYFIQNDLRCVQPYYYIFRVYAKERWLKRTILNVMEKEFTAHPQSYYKKKISSGDIRVNNEIVSEDYLLKHHDNISHTVHRHEPPVANSTIKIIHQDDQIVVVDKPSSIPVHPCGRYRHNSMTFILAKEYGILNLQPIHRLDRLTSGLLVLAKSKAVARKYGIAMQDGKMKKEYIAKVDGEFPSDPVDVDQPIQVNVASIAINECKDGGKSCQTRFERISFDQKTNTSIVRCLPKTGRTHQIRVHLKWLGHPISNDPLYGKGKKIQLADIKAVRPQSKQESGGKEEDIGVKDGNSSLFDEDCPECCHPHLDPDEEQLCLYLHALSYQSEEWKHQTELPFWANQ